MLGFLSLYLQTYGLVSILSPTFSGLVGLMPPNDMQLTVRYMFVTVLLKENKRFTQSVIIWIFWFYIHRIFTHKYLCMNGERDMLNLSYVKKYIASMRSTKKGIFMDFVNPLIFLFEMNIFGILPPGFPSCFWWDKQSECCHFSLYFFTF